MIYKILNNSSNSLKSCLNVPITQTAIKVYGSPLVICLSKCSCYLLIRIITLRCLICPVFRLYQLKLGINTVESQFQETVNV